MSTDPKHLRHDGSERRPSGAESKGEARADPGGHRSAAGSDYGDWTPDRGQPRRNDDRDAGTPPTPGASAAESGPAAGRDPAAPGGANPDSSPAGVPDADEAARAEAAAESNRNRDFDTPHVHSSTTSRRV